MINNGNYSLDEAIKIINNHKIKSNSLKNYYLRNMNNDELPSQILGYFGELQYDLETLNNLLEQFQLCYCNIIKNINDSARRECNLNNEINKLNLQLNGTNKEIINLQNEINFLKNKEMRNDNEDRANKLNKSYKDLNKFLNYSGNTNNDKFLFQQKNCFENKNYGRLTYTRCSNEEKNIKNNKLNNKPNNNINNNMNKSINNNINKNINNSIKNRINRKIKKENNKSISKSVNNSVNNIFSQDMNNNLFNKIDNQNFNNNNYPNGNTINNIDKMNNNYFSPTNNMIQNKDYVTNLNNNSNNYLLDNISIDNNNYNIPNSTSAIMNSKRIPKYKYENTTFNRRICDIPREKNNKASRINNILSVISNDENKLNELKSIFGNNIQAQLINGDINFDYLDKIENILCHMKTNKSIIPLSKRFQIQNRAKSNSVRKNKDAFNNNNNRFIRQKLRDRTLNKKTKKKWNTSRDFYIKK